jgi:NADH-quinone oxidoreductase subunit E
MVWEALDRRHASGAGPDKVLTDELRQQIAEEFTHYPSKQATLLSALRAVQNKYRHVSRQAMEEIAQVLEITPAEVLDCMTCYSHFWSQPQGRHLVMVCRGLGCEVCGGSELLEALKKKLGVNEHQTTPDGRFTLLTEECMGACEKAPYMLIDFEQVGPVRLEELDRILEKYS